MTIGSAAVAFTISHKDFIQDGHLLLGGAALTDSSANIFCQGNGNTESLMMETDSEELMKVGISLAVKTWKNAREELNFDIKDFNYVIGHQVGITHEKLLMESLELTSCPTFKSYHFLGNTDLWCT